MTYLSPFSPVLGVSSLGRFLPLVPCCWNKHHSHVWEFFPLFHVHNRVQHDGEFSIPFRPPSWNVITSVATSRMVSKRPINIDKISLPFSSHHRRPSLQPGERLTNIVDFICFANFTVSCTVSAHPPTFHACSRVALRVAISGYCHR